MPEPAAPEPTSHWLARHPRLAILFITATATTFALGSTLIRFSYDAGAGTLAIVMTRTTVAALCLGLLLKARGVGVALDRRERWAVPLIGLFMAGYSAAFYKGLEFMPVALTVLTFYTYPLMTGLYGWLTGRERLGATALLALPLAFAGLLLALDVSGHSFSLAGTGWAILGGAGFAAVLILSSLLLPKRADTRPRTFVMLTTAAIACILASAVTGDVRFPHALGGWAGLFASALCYAAAMTSILLAAAALGATRVAIVMNVEPIASLVLSFLILGDRLGPVQLVGAALVVVAIFIFRPSKAQAAPAMALRSEEEPVG